MIAPRAGARPPSAPPSAATPGSSTANSSPPRRASTFDSRTCCRERSATRDEHLVARAVAEDVVHVLEVVEVEPQDRAAAAALRRTCASSRSSAVSKERRLYRPVRWSWFAMCTSCCSKRLRSVTSRAIHWRPDDRARLVDERRRAQLHREDLPRRVAQLDLDGPRVLGVDVAAELRRDRHRRIRRHEPAERVSHQLRDRPAGEVLGALVRERDGALEIHREHRVRHPLEQHAVPLLGARELAGPLGHPQLELVARVHEVLLGRLDRVEHRVDVACQQRELVAAVHA